MHNARWM
jgi:hypothetical protein